MADYEKMTKEELEAELKKEQANLDDLEEEHHFILAQSGVHISAKRLEAMTQEYEADKKKLEDKIALLKKLIAEKQ